MNTKQTTQPETLVEAIRYFSDEETCLHFMMPLVWPNGVTCSHCGAKDAHFISTRRIWRCKGCKKQFSIKTGTVMEDSPLKLDKWLIAMWLISNAKNGISSYEIHRDLGITQKSAWFLLHRIRLAMKTGTFKKKFSGIVEADEAYVGGTVSNFKKQKLADLRKEAKAMKPGRPVHLGRLAKKAIVMGMLERGQNGKPSQMRAQLIEKARRPHIQEVVKANVEVGSKLMTDFHPSYRGMKETYIHETINHALAYARGNVHTNGLENFWALMKRTLVGTYVAAEPFHLERYLDEQCFRFNHRDETDGERFERVVGMMGGKRLTLAELTGKVAGAERPIV